MQDVHIGIATQTPLLRLPAARSSRVRRLVAPLRRARSAGQAGQAVPARALPQGSALLMEAEADPLEGHDISPGGVSRMVHQSVQAWRRQGWVRGAHWFSLQPAGPPEMLLEGAGVRLHNLRLPPQQLSAYARTKEKLWADIHGLAAPRFDVEDFRFYARYNGLASDAILEHVPDLDVAYVHDFQLLQVGAIVGLAAPCVLRWHVPFEPRRIPGYTRQFLLRMMEAYDGVIVSTRRDLEGLTNAGYHGRVRQVYPHCDPRPPRAPPGAAQELLDRLRIGTDEPVLLVVARMDPLKRQDLAIRALATLRRRHPGLLLVLVGNGSFSASRQSGLGLGKAERWRAGLEKLAQELGVADAVRFTGWLPDALVAPLYGRADAVLLPSDLEGFGLIAFEAWSHGRPCVVSSGCGASEVVQTGVNGAVFPSGDAAALAAAVEPLLASRERAGRLGEAGRAALAAHAPQAAAAHEAAFLEEAMARYGAPGGPHA